MQALLEHHVATGHKQQRCSARPELVIGQSSALQRALYTVWYNVYRHESDVSNPESPLLARINQHIRQNSKSERIHGRRTDVK